MYPFIFMKKSKIKERRVGTSCSTTATATAIANPEISPAETNRLLFFPLFLLGILMCHDCE